MYAMHVWANARMLQSTMFLLELFFLPSIVPQLLHSDHGRSVRTSFPQPHQTTSKPSGQPQAPHRLKLRLSHVQIPRVPLTTQHIRIDPDRPSRLSVHPLLPGSYSRLFRRIQHVVRRHNLLDDGDVVCKERGVGQEVRVERDEGVEDGEEAVHVSIAILCKFYACIHCSRVRTGLVPDYPCL
jgi:hypothetical protein